MKNLSKALIYIFLLGVSFSLIYFVVDGARLLPNNSHVESNNKTSNGSHDKNYTINLSKEQRREVKLLQLQNVEVPNHVLATLVYIRSEGQAPENFVGGRTFQNREKRLPKLKNDIYKEWDVYPKKPGKNRGAERLVTSSLKAYYTKDHYNSFISIKE